MAGYLVDDPRKVTTHRLLEMKQQGKKIAMLTSYDYTTAGIVDEAGVDCILVGDSASNVMAGNVTTLPITLDQMIYHARSVVRAVKRALVVCDMPFGTYQVNPTEGVRNAIRIMQETGADALKLEGGVEIIDTVRKILEAGIPVMGQVWHVRRSRPRRGRGQQATQRRKSTPRSGLLRLGGGESAGRTQRKGLRRTGNPRHRHRCRPFRRTSPGDRRYAG